MSSEHVASVTAALRADRAARRLGLADLVEFVAASGLSIEDCLRLTWLEVARTGQTGLAVTVPGRGVLPLSEVAVAVLDRRKGHHALWVFRVSPRQLAVAWRRVRGVMGLSDAGAADLRALRKAAVRRTGIAVPVEDIVERLEREQVSPAAGHVRLMAGTRTPALKRHAA